MESKAIETHDPAAMARERVQIGPIPTWVNPADYDKTFTPKIRGQVSELLKERQVHAELGQQFVRTAGRLETQHAVQNHSQWRLEFSPNTQSIILHSVKTYRGDVEREHASLEKIQFLQRESQLEGLMLHGSITLLLVLEDVSPGDILEFSYTESNRPKIMPEHTHCFFNLSAGVEIGKYHFLVRHSEGRGLKWKSSSPKLEPKITSENGELSWCWMDTQFSSPPPEEYMPYGHFVSSWMQISDCPDWQMVARAVLEAWEEDPPEDGLNRLVEEVTAASPDLTSRITRAIELIQDRFRYLSVVDLEVGGQIPAVAGTVIRRRYGDCKDLSFLLVRLLRALGVPARPVLINTGWGQFIASILPGPNMFNHVIVEYEIGAEKRWVDCTLKYQGGGALRRYVPDFGLGLPIDIETTELTPVPKGSVVGGSLDIKESLILDTTGGSSYFAVLVTAKGAQADYFRAQFANQSFEALSKSRLQRCANQFYCKASRIAQLESRDDRELNEFVFAEAFEITDWINEDKVTRSYSLKIGSNVTSGALALPSPAPRREPFALPFPCNRTHTIEIESGGLNSNSLPMVQIGNRFLTFSRRTRSWPKLLKFTFSLETLAPFVPANEVANYRKQVESIWQAANLHFRIPSGYAKPRRRSDFGTLPRKGPAPVIAPTPVAPSPEKPERVVSTEKIDTVLTGNSLAKSMPPAADGSQFQVPENETPQSRRRRSNRHGQGTEKMSQIGFFTFLGALVSFITGIVLFAIPSFRPFGLGLFFLTYPILVCSLVFAILGWRQCARHRNRYDGDNAYAIITIVFSGISLGLLMIPLVRGFHTGMVRAQAERQSYQSAAPASTPVAPATPATPPITGPTASPVTGSSGSPAGSLFIANPHRLPLDFQQFNFIFHPPPTPPWVQVNTREFAMHPVLAYMHSKRIFFVIVADKVGLGGLTSREHIIETTKSSLQQAGRFYKLVNEQQVSHGGLDGWQIESQVFLEGRYLYFVQWLYATNGVIYQFSTWGPPELKDDIKVEADMMATNFELTPEK